MKKFLAFLLLSAMLVAAFVSCGSTNTPTPEKTTEPTSEKESYEGKTVFSLDGEEVSFEKYRYYLYMTCATEEGADLTNEMTVKELKNMAVSAITDEYVLRKMAAENGVALDDDDKKSIEENIKSLEDLCKAAYGVTLDKYLESNYCSRALYKEVLEIQILNDKLFDKLFGENGTYVLDDKNVSEYIDKVGRIYDIYLSNVGYKSAENAKAVADAVERIVKSAEEGARKIGNGEKSVTEALENTLAVYETEKSKTSLVSSYNDYAARLMLLKKVIEEGKPDALLTFVRTSADKLYGNADETKEVKTFAEKVAAGKDGIEECQKVLENYRAYIAKQLSSALETGETDEPYAIHYDALFALRFLYAYRTFENGNEKALENFAVELLDEAFSQAALTYSEVRQEPSVGVYFKISSEDETLVNAYNALKEGEMSGVITVSSGVHFFKRLIPDTAYFKDHFYGEYLFDDMIEEGAKKVKVTYEDIYEKITPTEL